MDLLVHKQNRESRNAQREESLANSSRATGHRKKKETDLLHPSTCREMNEAVGLHSREKEPEYQKLVWGQRKKG